MKKQLLTLYASVFSRECFSGFNDFILRAALKAKGYDNFRNGVESGEDFFISEILSPSHPKLCIDIGANIGNYSVSLLEKTNAKVISFEPLPTAFEVLRERTSKFNARSVVENKGVGSGNGVLTIHYSPDALSHASFSEDVKKVPYVKNEMKADVNVVTLDSYLRETSIDAIDFIKIDTEGYEYEVICGAVETLKELKPKFIQIEFNWHQLFRGNTINTFSGMLIDYDVYQLIPGGWMKRDPKDPFSNIYMFSNFVFVRR